MHIVSNTIQTFVIPRDRWIYSKQWKTNTVIYSPNKSLLFVFPSGVFVVGNIKMTVQHTNVLKTIIDIMRFDVLIFIQTKFFFLYILRTDEPKYLPYHDDVLLLLWLCGGENPVDGWMKLQSQSRWITKHIEKPISEWNRNYIVQSFHFSAIHQWKVFFWQLNEEA